MLVLGIETSCDETAAAVVDEARTVHGEAIASQIAEHGPYGGVVPEIAARAHVEHLDGLVRGVMSQAGIGFDRLDAVAATAGPGLIGGLLVGLVTAKAIAAARSIPLIAVNHLEAHALSVRLVDEAPFPYLALLISGGHCQLVSVDGVGAYHRLGTTLDDAVGEAFDKSAKMLGLGYPGGPALERAAQGGDGARFALPRPMRGRQGCDFSFAGLKTAVRHAIAALPSEPAPRDVADLAASFQTAVGDVLCDRAANAFALYRAAHGGVDADELFVVAGGVAANAYLRTRIKALVAEHGFRLAVPPAALCTDNAAMVAWAGVERFAHGLTDPLDVPARARWPLGAGGAPPTP